MNKSRPILGNVRNRLHAAIGAVGVAALVAAGGAAAAAITLGEQDFTSGALLTGGIAEFTAVQGGEPPPFGLFFGGDTLQQATPGPFIVSWTFNFAPGAAGSAAIAFGIFDHDTAAAGTQLATFTLDGVDLTGDLNALMEAPGIGTGAQYDVFSLALTGAALAVLTDGVATFSMRLDGPAICGAVGGTTLCDPNVGNGAALDFSTLTVTAGQVAEPTTLALIAVAILALAFILRRASRRTRRRH